MDVDAVQAQRDLVSLIAHVNNDREPVVITSPAGDAVLIAADDYTALQETSYLLSSPANAQRLLGSLEQARPVQT